MGARTSTLTGVIVLDTNVLEGSGFKSLDGPFVGVLLAVARARGENILLPQVVVDEFLAHRLHEAEAAVEAAQAASTKLAKLAPGWAAPSEWPDPDAMITPLINRLNLKFPSMPHVAGVAEEALQREIHRKAPALRDWGKGGGARDVVVWLTALEAARVRDETVYLVSNDGRAFGKEGRLLPELQAEVDALRAGKVVYCGGIDGLFAQLAEKRQLKLTAVDLAEAERSWIAADELFRWAGATLFGLRLTPGREGSQYFLKHSGPELITASDVRAYRVDETTWATFRARWSSLVDLEEEGEGAGLPQKVSVPFRLYATLLVQLDAEEKRVLKAEVLDSGGLVRNPVRE